MKDFINIAKNYVGACEGGLTHHSIVDYYNSQRPLPRGYHVSYTDSWCATFVSVILLKAGCKGYSECSAERLRKQMSKHQVKGKGTRNDIIFYDWDLDHWSDHVGIIKSYDKDSDTYTVIEGNYHDSVKIRVIQASSKSIRGIYRIYDGKSSESPYGASARIRKVRKKSVKTIAKEVIAGKWGNGSDRADKLKKAGYDPKKVQEEVNKMI